MSTLYEFDRLRTLSRYYGSLASLKDAIEALDEGNASDGVVTPALREALESSGVSLRSPEEPSATSSDGLSGGS